MTYITVYLLYNPIIFVIKICEHNGVFPERQLS